MLSQVFNPVVWWLKSGDLRIMRGIISNPKAKGFFVQRRASPSLTASNDGNFIVHDILFSKETVSHLSPFRKRLCKVETLKLVGVLKLEPYLFSNAVGSQKLDALFCVTIYYCVESSNEDKLHQCRNSFLITVRISSLWIAQSKTEWQDAIIVFQNQKLYRSSAML